MAQYILLLYDDPAGWKTLSPEEQQAALEKYIAWTKKPFTRGSQRLIEEHCRTIRPQAGGPPRVTDGPFSETKEVLGGYYVIEAADYDEAVKLALDHPHVVYGNPIEIRQIFGT